MDRRRWMLLAAAAASGGCAVPPAAPHRPVARQAMALPPPRPSTLGPADGAWLNRLTWGLNAPTAAELQQAGRTRWLAQQLQAAPWPPRLPEPVEQHIARMTISRTPVAALARRMDARRQAFQREPDAELKRAARQDWQREMNRLADEAATRQLLRALYSPRQLQDQMGWFWVNHFSVHARKAQLRALVGDYDDRLHALALGRFRDLLGAAVFHPAMLDYLDNAQNAAGHVNENLGRELLELHTLGVDGGYHQADVQALARVLTGLSVSLRETPPRLPPPHQALYWRQGLVEFHPGRHDAGPKTLLGQAVSGQGVAEIEGVLDRLAAHPATARHLSRKIAQYFVADDPPPALLARMEASFREHDGRIDELLRTMIGSPEFDASLGRRFKDPMHYVISAVRQGWSDRTIVNPAPLRLWLQRLAERPFLRETPDGYALDAMAWNSPGQLTTRFEIASLLGHGAPNLFREDPDLPPDTPPPAPQFDTALFRRLIAPQLAPASRQALAQAIGPAEWNTLWLSSPEFMQR